MVLDTNNNINHQLITIQQNNLLINLKLISSIIDFINQNTIRLKQPITNLNLYNQWQYLDKGGKKSSKGTLAIYSNGITCLKLTISENYWQCVYKKIHYKNLLTEKNNQILNLTLKSIFINDNSLLGVI